MLVVHYFLAASVSAFRQVTAIISGNQSLSFLVLTYGIFCPHHHGKIGHRQLKGTWVYFGIQFQQRQCTTMVVWEGRGRAATVQPVVRK